MTSTVDGATEARHNAAARAEADLWTTYREGAAQRAADEARRRWPECRPSETAYGPLWPDAHAVVWPRSGGDGTCSHHAPDSCADCDGTAEEARDARRSRTTTATEATR